MQICGLYPEKNHNQKHNCIPLFLGSPGASAGKESVCSAGDLGLIPGLGISPGGGLGNPLQYSGLENPYRQRSLVGCSPRGRKESDMTARLSTAQDGDDRLEEGKGSWCGWRFSEG